ncbi:uncharacterized protein LOC120255260 [Dioscorea cayenensis subsp. rotundata]|uniref:Uncharacterized protein LOC120255260 n=1 Tax=Dioscorea cayennensis subsp. rotundata TaxID=55577 RepID=A0AB40AVH7_DIOCR|nr:uncharacterized protein LOC120255260 [Dioscorea cayenensis subsp. rotundata]
MDDNHFDRIVRFTSTKEAWEHIQSEYYGSSRIVSIKGLGYELEEKEVVSKVMRSLTIKYDNVVTSIEEARDVDKLSLNELSGSLQAYEARLNRFVDQPTNKVLYVKGEASTSSGSPLESEDWSSDFYRGRGYARGRGRGFRGRGRGYDAGGRGGMNNTKGTFDVPRGYSCDSQSYAQLEQQYGRGGQRQSHRTTTNQRGGRGSYQGVQCFHCGKYGHIKAYCWSLNRVQEQNINTEESQQSSDTGSLFMVHDATMKTDQENSAIWLLDSGCSHHMTGKKALVTKLDESLCHIVKLVDDQEVKVNGERICCYYSSKWRKEIHS